VEFNAIIRLLLFRRIGKFRATVFPGKQSVPAVIANFEPRPGDCRFAKEPKPRCLACNTFFRAESHERRITVGDQEQDNDIQKLGELMKGIRFATLTATDEDGSLRSRPMTTQDIEFDGDLWFFTSADAEKVSEVYTTGRT